MPITRNVARGLDVDECKEAGVLSPELALVDPKLAECARTGLPYVEDTLGRVERLLQAQRLEVSHVVVTGPTPNVQLRGRRRRPSVRIVAVATACIIAGSIMFGVRVDVRGDPAGAEPAIPASSAVSEVSPPDPRPDSEPTRGAVVREAPRTKAAGVRAPDRFAWAPVSGASAYHMEIFRDSQRIFVAETKQPQVTLPRTWKLAGVKHALLPGRYRWYVWSVVSGRRSSQAIVQSTVVVSSG